MDRKNIAAKIGWVPGKVTSEAEWLDSITLISLQRGISRADAAAILKRKRPNLWKAVCKERQQAKG